MSLVVNSSLQLEPKRRKIEHLAIKDSLFCNCDHWFVRYGICISCNSKVDKSKGICFDYLDEGITMSHKALTFTKRVVSQISWLEDKKLHLVLDLDHTLIHTVRTSQLSESYKYLAGEAKSRKDLWRFNSGYASETLIKLRPFVHGFLKEASEMFSMYVYTKGCHEYAQLVLELIDPDKVYFGERVISRRECPRAKKTLDLVLADERGIVIVDDMCSVWPDHRKNWLQIAKMEEVDESEEKGPLASVLRFLKEVHKGFFSDCSEQELDAMDVRPLLREPSSRSKRKTD
ncbi:hypothetical protein EUTSA_v10000277mg [Eutrema salsugineum]|uniref:RNA polymerase II C-terminal domain phosphatase-like n=1 Tax=Eutrema salsugineum TaxID=72664 RepID=V4LW04_EUTSA|nr:hypothetical protein EUTSA_v10000277mg [Eutrema salsugineum]